MDADSLDADLELLRTSAVTAGILAAGFFRRDIKTWTKGKASPVSEADISVDTFLRQSLLAARPDYGWLSEETPDDAERLAKRRVFVVDPIDGTKGFLRGQDNWTVCLAVVEDGKAVAGVVYAPVRDEMFWARRGGGAFYNAQPLQAGETMSPPVIPAGRAVRRALSEAGLASVDGERPPSLAYLLMLAARGDIGAAVARRGAQDWDIAAAAVILAEAGTALVDVCVGPPVFNKPETRHAALAAYNAPAFGAPLGKALRKTFGCPSERAAHAGTEGVSPMSEVKSDQLLHIVLGGELQDLDKVTFRDLDAVDFVGAYPDYRSAYDAWKEKAQQTVDNAQMRYFIVHAHKLLDPRDDAE